MYLGLTHVLLPPSRFHCTPLPTIYVPFPSQIHILKAKQINKIQRWHTQNYTEKLSPKTTTTTTDDDNDNDDNLLKLFKGEYTHTHKCMHTKLLVTSLGVIVQ